MNKKIGIGEEKNVYLDPGNPERVLAKFHAEIKHSPNQIKGRYYLTKILHILFPENIPDIHAAGKKTRKDFLLLQKAPTDKLHQAYQQREIANRQSSEVKPDIENQANEFALKMRRHPKIRELREQIWQASGLIIDSYFPNYSESELESGNLIYADNSFLPWSKNITTKSIRRLFDFNKLHQSINALKDDNTKQMALSYLKRLELLYEQEKSNLGLTEVYE